MGDGEVLVLLNNDVFCRPDWLERLVAPLETEPQTGSVACLLVQPGEQVIDSVGLCADRTLAGFPRLAGLPVARAVDARPRLAGPAGAAGAYRRTAWDQVGGLNEAIFAYSEDLDLALSLRGAGWKASVVPEAVGMHLGSATHGHRTARQRRHAGFARGYLLHRSLRDPAEPSGDAGAHHRGDGGSRRRGLLARLCGPVRTSRRLARGERRPRPHRSGRCARSRDWDARLARVADEDLRA
jgi:hypothetical protein